MNFNRFPLVLATMLALLAVFLEATSLERRYRHMGEISTGNNGYEPADMPSNLRQVAARRGNQSERKRRGFARWNVPQEDYQRFNRWQPAAYVLSRPYFIPVYGPAGQIPIYFPPQQFNHNVGVPPDNPSPFTAPTYLPPSQTTEKPKIPIIGNRNPGFDDDDDDDRPIWGTSVQTQRPISPVRRPARPQQSPAISQQRPSRPQQSPIIPTRPPKLKSTTETPPLEHKIPLNAIDESMESAIDNIFGRPAEKPLQPSPAIAANSVRRTTTFRPATTFRPTTTRSRTTTTGNTGPSNCVWAVVSCCSAASTNVAEACFEQRGCPGPFWDRSPCESDFAKAAINKALEYYGR